ncbi:hypothetical protein E8E12_009492 [Didymella heteroderae]|uniref:Uncharacterized protein n=1 Tax=Didymella heteroderae TaxID=1769908 RepID=A0A9P4WV76_9PLEO|nr:hypothetical protein E8E12_009492 [Didymella heteroderae]
MGNCTRKQAQLLLAFKVLHFVNQLQRRVKTRMQRGSDDDVRLGSHLQADRKALRRIPGMSRLGDRGAKEPQQIANRISKCRKNNQKSLRPVLRLRTSVSGTSVRSNESGEEVQHDDWLAEQGQRVGLDIDETFVANLEHLLLWLQGKLENALVRKARDELLYPMGDHTKNQRKLLTCLDEFAEKPRPLSISFPWTIKPSLAVLWGVCWMFYDRAGNVPAGPEVGNDRVPVNRVLQRVDVPWTAPGSSEYLNFGLEMIGLQPQPEVQQQTGDNMPVGPESDVFEAARNADTWQPDWHHLESRHPSLTNSNLSPIGSDSTAPFPGKD